MENRTNELKKFIRSRIETCADNVYFRHSNSDSKYPRVVFDLKMLSNDDIYQKYILTLDLYDKFNLEIIDNLADKIEENIGFLDFLGEDFLIKIYPNNDRQYIEETDKTLQRILMSFELRYFTRSE